MLLCVRYKVTDLMGERQYLIDLTFKACFDAMEPCQQTVLILRNYLVTKPQCAWYTGFIESGKQEARFMKMVCFARDSISE